MSHKARWSECAASRVRRFGCWPSGDVHVSSVRMAASASLPLFAPPLTVGPSVSVCRPPPLRRIHCNGGTQSPTKVWRSITKSTSTTASAQGEQSLASKMVFAGNSSMTYACSALHFDLFARRHLLLGRLSSPLSFRASLCVPACVCMHACAGLSVSLPTSARLSVSCFSLPVILSLPSHLSLLVPAPLLPPLPAHAARGLRWECWRVQKGSAELTIHTNCCVLVDHALPRRV